MENQIQSILKKAASVGEEFSINKEIKNFSKVEPLLYADVQGGDTEGHQGGDAGDREHGDNEGDAIYTNDITGELHQRNVHLSKLIEVRETYFKK